MKKIFLFESFKDISLQFVLILLSIIGFITYINAVFHPFVHDDVVFIVKNPAIQELSFKSIFQQTISSDRDTSLINTYYRPLLEFFYRLGYQLFGFNPAGFHFINIFFHIINSFLVFILFNVLWKNQKGMALAASIVFLTHPMQSEAVACISGISNLVFAGLCLLSFILYLYSMETERQKRGETLWYYLLSLLIFALAVLAKEQAIVLPILILWYEVILGENKNTNRRRIRFVRWAGFIFVVSFYFLLRKYVLGITMPNVFGSMPEFFLRMKAVPLTLLTYLGIIFFPLDLHYYRSVDILSPVLGAISILGFILLCVGYLIIRIPAPYKQRIIFGSGWFIIAFGPTLNIVPLINEYSFILTAEHFLYLPFVGILIIAACLWKVVLKQIKKENVKSISIYIFVVFICIFIVMTIKQNSYWRGEIPLFERMLKYEKKFGRGHLLLAKAYYNEGQYSKAIEHYAFAEKIFREYLQKVTGENVSSFYQGFINEIYFDLARCYEALGNVEQAVEYYHQLLRMYPNSGAAHNNLGTLYMQKGGYDLAIEHFEKAVKIDAKDVRAMNNLAICYIHKEEKAKAEEIFNKILTIEPGFTSARDNLNFLLQSK